MKVIKDDVSIVLGGAAGQGIQTVEVLLTHALKKARYHVFGTKEYMSRIRGGINTTEIRIASRRVRAFVKRIDLLVPFKKGTLTWVKDRISDNTIVLGEKENVEEEFLGKINLVEIPLTKTALKVGSQLYLNTVAAGLIFGLFGVPVEIIESEIRNYFKGKSEKIVEKNVEAVREGYNIGRSIREKGEIVVEIKPDEKVKEEILLSGTEAVGIGALAGGMNFLSFYPMSPSTGVSTFAAQHAEEFEIVVEQAEDEIAAINMALGAWFAGARAMVSTSGGGFALMCEAISLAGMAENPVVIHLAQRPGPATGLPTRTMQGDLNLVLHAGHGDFPRIILAPGTLEEAFYLTAEAFNLADKYQVPVIILTDQYFVDSYYNLPEPDVSKVKVEKYIVKAEKGYKRYKLTEDGISPRAIPGYGEDVVVANGNEHDEWGDITEDAEITRKMQEKRAIKKLETIKRNAPFPKIIGREDAKFYVISWGSTFHIVEEALELLKRDDVAHVHFSWLYPLNPKIKDILTGKTLIAVENNITGQFADLLKKELDIKVDHKILKYDGRPFAVEEVYESLKEVIK
ncbi:MAG: 2-oxoglutarate/2-oxoacid ferredoxin oxidoreductase subunit alpha [Pyrococcus sp.]|uniref:2-oxoacid:acceptor oxidoreductase subunit alpha n=1 Tax=Pyrococcus sp. TaxID=33866 RepID=UPI002588FCC1|nr:2-oxoacid:acceptor oxidoreductase subunit alpha [Pyrococcus sp.]MDK2870075.1 2-oxoglutarate/2-oxoacid ferredoxin oxidoreductase subunit alpha [Pyrococcus sp.]